MNEYVFAIDERGRRLDSYLLGVHGDTYEALEARAAADHPNQRYMRGDEEMQQKFVSEGLVYVDGAFQEDIVTEEERRVQQREQAKAEYEKTRNALLEAFNGALIEGDEETMNEIREELQELKESYAEGVKEDV